MRNKFKLMLLSMATLGLFSCADDSSSEITNNTEKYAYINTAFSLPSSGYTRSATDNYPENGNGDTNSDANPDSEIGHDYENEIRSILLVIADKDNTYITHMAVSSLQQTSNTPDGIKFTATSKIPYDVLEDAYNGTLKNNKEVHLYVYCNYTDDILTAFNDLQGGTATDKDWLNWSGTLTENLNETPTPNIWAQRYFLMTNATSADKQEYSFPEDINDWEEYVNKDNAFNLTKNEAIKVERSAARIDFKDGSTTKDQTYPVVDENNNEIFKVKLIEMSLVNMSNQFYYLRRVSDDGMPKSNDNKWEIGGYEYYTSPEKGNYNYVVDVDAAYKTNEKGINPANAGEHFNFCLFDTDGKYATENWYTSEISDVLGGINDNWNVSEEKPKGSYNIWRYVTENTIPSPDEQQKNIQSTGIVFKAKITAGDDMSTELKNALDNAQSTLYSHNSTFYVGIDGLAEAIEDDKEGPLARDLKTALEHYKNGNDVTIDNLGNKISSIDEKEFNKAVAKFGDITVYTVTGDGADKGYYCYYFYWNRHNDNGRSGKMGPMEFATVRNNVYKLSVTGINQLGHPLDPDDDPEPSTPETPDEDPTNYLKVEVEVLPWVVRENNITF